MKNLLILALMMSGVPACAFAQETNPAADPNPANEEVVELSTFRVVSRNDEGYGSTHNIGGSRVSLPILEIPSSIIGINPELIKDFGALDTYEAIGFVSGVATAEGGNYTLRGFAQSGVNYRDGLKDREMGLNSSANVAGSYERIEVIKGPAGVLYGSHSMGGIVNRVTKNPLGSPMTRIAIGLGAGWDEYGQASIDTTGPIGKTGFGYRLIMTTRMGNKAWGGHDDRNAFVGMLNYKFGKAIKQTLWFRFNYFWGDNTSEQWVNFVDKDIRLPRFFSGDNREAMNFPDDSLSIQRTRTYEVGYEGQAFMLGGRWTVRLLARFNKNWGDKSPSYAGGTVLAVDGGGNKIGSSEDMSIDDPRIADWRTELLVREFESFYNMNGMFFDAVAKYDIGPTRHTIISSAEAGRRALRRTFKFWKAKFPNAPAGVPNTYSIIPSMAAIDLTGYNADRIISEGGTPGFTVQNAPTDVTEQAVSIQDNIGLLGNRLVFVASTRYDWSHNVGYTARLDSNGNVYCIRKPGVVKKESPTYKFGIVVQPLPGLGIFAQKATTYVPGGGETTPNQEGKVDELGVKTDLFGHDLIATMSVFKMRLDNIMVAVPRPPEQGGGTMMVPAGVQHTKGWEADITWRPFRPISFVIAYSDLTSLNENGVPFRGVPQSPNYSIWGKYTLGKTFLRGLSIGGGYKFVSKRPGDATASFWLPKYEQTDILVSYSPPRSNWSIQANIFNLFDTEDIRFSVNRTLVSPCMPRSIRISMNYTFR